jgi:hypothetical protein
MTDKATQFLTAADKTEDKLVLTLRISTNPFKKTEKNLMAHIKMIDAGDDPISGQWVALRIDKNPKADFKGTPNKTGSGISFMIKDKTFVEQMKTGKIMKAQVKRNSGYRVVAFSLAGFNEGLAWLEEGDRKSTQAAAAKKAAEPKVVKTKIPIALKAKDGSGTVDIKELAGRIRFVVRRPGDILDNKVKLHVDGKMLKEYSASKGGQEQYTGHTVIFTPMFEERDAIQKGSEMCITVRSVIRGSRAMCFDVSNIVFH